VKLIREFCLVCQGGSQLFVRECHESGCHFHGFRMGKSGLSRPVTEEQRQASRDRLARMREKRVGLTE
jgi:hypothetical protein